MSFDLRSLPGHLLNRPLPNYHPPPTLLPFLLKQYDWALILPPVVAPSTFQQQVLKHCPSFNNPMQVRAPPFLALPLLPSGILVPVHDPSSSVLT